MAFDVTQKNPMRGIHKLEDFEAVIRALEDPNRPEAIKRIERKLTDLYAKVDHLNIERGRLLSDAALTEEELLRLVKSLE